MGELHCGCWKISNSLFCSSYSGITCWLSLAKILSVDNSLSVALKLTNVHDRLWHFPHHRHLIHLVGVRVKVWITSDSYDLLIARSQWSQLHLLVLVACLILGCDFPLLLVHVIGRPRIKVSTFTNSNLVLTASEFVSRITWICKVTQNYQSLRQIRDKEESLDAMGT